MDNDNKEALSVDVGLRLRQLRDERKISMRTLARASSLSANALSMIERGLTSPSVSTLNKLAMALEVPITAFFRHQPDRQTIVYRKATQRTRVPLLRGLWEDLGGESFTERIESFMLTLESGGSSGPHSMLHTGSEFVFIVRGQLEYEVGAEHFLLETGDSLMFAAHINHRWRNPGPNVTSALVLIAAFEEDDRPSEYHLAVHDQDEPELPQL
jgi:transcriptional regulator with XRE-family HTH domain